MCQHRSVPDFQEPAAWTETGLPRVLIEHPEAVVRRELDRDLRDAGYDVTTCGGPGSGWACPELRQEPCPAVAGADVVVTGLVGTRLGRVIARRVRRERPELPVIVEATDRMARQFGDDVSTAHVFPLSPGRVREAVSAARSATSG